MSDDREKLYTALRNADKAGDTAAAKKLADYIRSMPAEGGAATPKRPGDDVPGGGKSGNRKDYGVAADDGPHDNLLGKIISPVDAALSAGSGIVGGLVGSVAGVGNNLINGRAPAAPEGEQYGSRIAERIARPPATQTGRAILEGVGKVAEPLAAIAPAELAALSGAASPAMRGVRAAADTTNAPIAAAEAANVAGSQGMRLRDLVRAPAQMSGGGAADVAQVTQRAERAAALPVPIKLTKGQLTRDRTQVAFERETAKQKEGAPLASNYDNQNASFMQNLDEGVDATGAQNVTARALGKSVSNATAAKEKASMQRVNDLYKQARDAGEMQQPVDVSALADWVQKNKGKDKLAPIVSTIESELKQNAKIEGGGYDSLTLARRPTTTTMTLDGSEDLRQAINKLSEPGTPNVVYGKEAKGLIDAAQEGRGGDLFKQARRAYENHANEFDNRNVISKLLDTKPGTKDRAVAYEDVFRHSILNSSTDDVRHLFRSLTAHPAGQDEAVVAAGQQAASDLRGAVVNHIKDEMTKNLNVDSTGARTGSAARIDSIVRELDQDGKLDVIFGKQGAEKVRDLRDVALDLYTSPAGTVNTSNTASALMRKLDDVAAYAKGTPVIGKAVNYTTQAIKSANTRRKVRDAINPNLKDLAGGKN